MEFFIAIFVSAAGFLAYRQVIKDFSDSKNEKEDAKK